ncbi:defensin-like protein 2 [Raphanus sativus]|uniref:Defensin-like protein 2 n=1 Tax=Raphanus sativus TaxID=3726 RepID=A0A6J0M0W1_RAPSA|nr:defensin-like protein 2 [Raphanus sativus]
MAFATKSVSSFAIIFILVLVIFEVPEIEAHDNECLVEYGGDVGFSFCAPEIFPSFCYTNCRKDKGAQGGTCIWGDYGTVEVKCLCDYCSDIPNDKILSGGI